MVPVFLAGAVAGAYAAKRWPEQTREALAALRRSGVEALVMSMAVASLPVGKAKSLVAGAPMLTKKEI